MSDTDDGTSTAASPESSESDENQNDRQSRRKDLRYAAVGGVAAALLGFGTMATVGISRTFAARRMIEALLPTARFAASAFIAGGASIMALMLTLLTFSMSNDLTFSRSHYKRTREIALMTCAVIVASVLLLMFVSFPLGEADVSPGWYLWVYYGLLFGGAATGGLFIAMVMMLYYAIRELIGAAEDPEASLLVVESG